jgi:hypothetical protein
LIFSFSLHTVHLVAISVQAGTAQQAAMPLNRGYGELSLTGEGRQPMVSSNGDLEVEHSGLEVSEGK